MSGIDFPECYVEHSTQHDSTTYEEESELTRRGIDLFGMNEIIISTKLLRSIRGKCEFALVCSQMDSNNEPESKLIICDGGCKGT